MRLSKWLGAAVSAVALAGAVTGVAIGGSGVADAATVPAGGTWATAQPFPGFSARNADVDALTCPSPGNCAVVGSTSGAVLTPVVGAEVNGRWTNSQVLSWPASLGTGSFGTFTSVSCGAPGDCSAVGWYHGAYGGMANAFYVSETAGAWGTPTVVAGADQPAGTVSEVNGLSCPAAGYCAVVGEYIDAATGGRDISTPFILDEANGTWGTPRPVPGLANLPSGGALVSLNSVSCAAPGDCTASGLLGGSTGEPFVVTQTGGVWGNAQQLATGEPVWGTAISCPDATDCTVAGLWTPASGGAYTVDEVNGVWRQPQVLSMPAVPWPLAPTFITNAPFLGCRSAGNCVIVVNTQYSNGKTGISAPFAATETSGGAWTTGALLPGFQPSSESGVVQGLSCVPDGDCTIAGSYGVGADDTYTIWTAVSRPDGSIAAMQPGYQSVGNSNVNRLSCPQDGYCTLGFFSNSADMNMLETEATASTIGLTASAAKVTYGAEQSEKLTATVSSPAGGPPTGTVTVTSSTGGPPCTITLAGGTGTCTLTAQQFPAGTGTLTASYSGDAAYLPASGTAAVTISQAATATGLSVTPGGITFSGTATRLAVAGTVSSTAGTPSGYATARVDGHAVPGCVNVGFSAGRVACTGTTAVLTGGRHSVTLSYSGGGNFAASASPALALTVGVARSTPSLSLSRSVVTYGGENAERFTVAVSHVGAVYPTGKAQVRTGRTTLCTVNLSSKGAGSCTLTTRQLRAGGYAIVGVYLGNANYHSSQSAGKALRVAP